jgi:ribonuclease HI
MIQIYCAVSVTDDGEPTQMAGAGAVLSFDDAKYRMFGFAMGCSSSQLAKIQCVRLALSSILAIHRKTETIIYMADNFVQDALLNKDPTLANELDELRAKLKSYLNLSFGADLDSELMKMAQSLAGKALENQQHYDSKTVDSLEGAGEK